MTITATILKITTSISPVDNTTSQNINFAIQNDAISNTWYRGNIGGISGDAQTFLNANGSDLYIAAQAGNVTMTQKQVNIGNFAWQHWTNRDIFAIAHYTYTTGMLSGAATLAAYRTVLQNALTELAPLSGSQFDTEFTNERVALALNIAVNTMTLAQCQAFATLMDRWLSARRVDCIWAQSIVGLTL